MEAFSGYTVYLASRYSGPGEGTDTLFVYSAIAFRLTYILINDNTDSTMLEVKKIEQTVKNSGLNGNETYLIGQLQGHADGVDDGDVSFGVESA